MSDLPNRELRREENLHYVKPLTSVGGLTFDGFALAGDGLTDWSQGSNLNTDSGQYIHESTQHTNALNYAPSADYSGAAYPGDNFNYWLYLIGKEEIIGAMFEEVEVETWNPTDVNGNYHAYSHTYEVQPDNPGSGEGGGKLELEGTFAQQGSVKIGTFNIADKVFKEDTSANEG